MLTLRSFHSTDWPVLVQYQYPGMSKDEAQKLIAEFNSGFYNGQRNQMLAVDHNGLLVGFVSLLEQEPGVASEGVDIYPPYRRRGYAYAAIRQLLSLSHGYHAITAQIRKDNIASLALHQKLGFQIESEFVNRRGYPVYALSLALPQEIAASVRSSQ